MLGNLGAVWNVASDCCVAVHSLITNALSFSFNLSYFIGQLIVKFGVALVSLLIESVLTLQTLLEVLTEDYLVFLSDIRSAISFLFTTLFDAGESVIQTLLGFCSTVAQGVLVVQNFFVLLFYGVIEFISSIISAIHYCLVLIKNSLVLVGLTSWDLFVYFPYKVVALKKASVSLALQCMGSIRDGVNSFRIRLQYGLHAAALFVSDIPKESLYGLCVCIILGFICVKYHRSIRPLLVRNVVCILSQCQKTLITAWTYLEAFTLWLLTNQITPSFNGTRQLATATGPNMPVAAPESDDNDDGDGAADGHAEQVERKAPPEPEDRLCVVCQDQEKCTIILPCRHVCLCYDCCVTIKRTLGRCPICRHIVRRTMRVYI